MVTQPMELIMRSSYSLKILSSPENQRLRFTPDQRPDSIVISRLSFPASFLES